MIKTFANSETESFFKTGKSRRWQKEILKRATMRLNQLDAAVDVLDLRMPPSINNGASVSVLKTAMPMMSKLWITTERSKQ